MARSLTQTKAGSPKLCGAACSRGIAGLYLWSAVHTEPRPPGWLDLTPSEVPSRKTESSHQLQRLLFAHPGFLFNRKYPGLEKITRKFSHADALQAVFEGPLSVSFIKERLFTFPGQSCVSIFSIYSFRPDDTFVPSIVYLYIQVLDRGSSFSSMTVLSGIVRLSRLS